MSSFELNSVVISIVIALAIADILASCGRLVRRRDRIRRPGLYLALSALLFLWLILHWLGLTNYRDLEFERFGQSFLAFSPSLCGALATFVLTPDLTDGTEIDLRAHYFTVAPWVYPLVVGFSLLATISDIVLLGGASLVLILGNAFFSALLLWLASSSRVAVHRAVLGLSLIMTATVILAV